MVLPSVKVSSVKDQSLSRLLLALRIVESSANNTTIDDISHGSSSSSDVGGKKSIVTFTDLLCSLLLLRREFLSIEALLDLTLTKCSI